MRIGFTNIYAWRPHVEHMQYLALLASQSGHEVRYLACDGDFPSCYSRELRPQNLDAWECLKCRAGSSRSYSAEHVSSIGKLAAAPLQLDARFNAWARSSANTLQRFETPAEFDSALAAQTASRLAPAVALAHAAATRWIEREKLDGVYLYNGRMDATRGVLEAARDAGVPFVSVERSWFGDGIQLLPGEDCIGLRNVDRMVAAYNDAPLTRSQAGRIARHVASRFLRVNTSEWRAYNRGAEPATWPHPADGPRILILPSSRNEFHGHADWHNRWREPTQALDAVLAHLGLNGSHCVLRCHPNWSELIGQATGERPERYYTDWARSRGVTVVGSHDRSSTLSLIEQADAIIVNGSSAALEAGILGKQIIATGPATYQAAGCASLVYSPEALANLRLSNDAAAAALTTRRTLRYGCTMVARVPQFAREVRAKGSFDYEYSRTADAARVGRIVHEQQLDADDSQTFVSQEAEDLVIDMIRSRRWAELVNEDPDVASSQAESMSVSRRPLFKAVDRLRRLRPTGDR